jgi:NOL1/NOP2/fmu family ribosome biogenesis protein
MCANRQAEILDRAYEMLVPGGRICYSTCTFARLEDEEAVASFITRHPDMKVIEERRLWPHEVKGEGHYACLLEKGDTDGRGEAARDNREYYSFKKINEKLLADYYGFLKETVKEPKLWKQNLILINDLLYMLPKDCPDFEGLHVLRGGLFLGTLKKNRFEPSHAFALSLKKEEVQHTVDLPRDSQLISDYLLGQSLRIDVADGWTLITVDGYSIGWGKAVKGQIKNHYPKGLRRL